MPGRKYAATGKYRYGFNGKENDNDVKGEGNQQDYGMRIYDPRLGRFLSVDPLSDEYPELTPYQFASNRPIDGIDLDGLEWVEAEIAIVNGKPKLTIISNDKVSPIGIEYSHYTINIKYNGNGQHYRFTTDDPSSFWSSTSIYGYNSYAAKYAEFIKDPVTNIFSGNVVSVEQGFIEAVGDYGAVEMISPSRPSTGTATSKSATTSANTKPTTTTAPNNQATAVNGKNTGAADANTAGKMQQQPVQQAQAKHHIATNKNKVSTLTGGPWTPKFEPFFKKAGLDINKGSENLVNVLNHKGPHPKQYHDLVLDRLTKATTGIKANTSAYKTAVTNTLQAIGKEAQTVGTTVNKLLTE